MKARRRGARRIRTPGWALRALIGLAIALALTSASDVGVAATAARPGWSRPVSISGPQGDLGEDVPVLAVNARGDAIAVWDRAGTEINGFVPFTVEAAFRPAGRTWRRPLEVGTSVGFDCCGEGLDPTPMPSVAINAHGAAIVTWRGGDQSMMAEVEAAVRSARGRWSKPELLSPAYSLLPAAGIDPRGDATVVWFPGQGIQAAYRPAGGSWRRPVTISATADWEGADVAFNARGDAVVSWEQSTAFGRVVWTASRPAGAGWRKPTRAVTERSGPSLSAYYTRVALSPRGDALLTWTSIGGYIRATYRPRGGTWHKPITVRAGTESGLPTIALDGQGRALAVWIRGRYLEMADVSNHGVWKRPVGVAVVASNSSAGLALDARGDSVLAWHSPRGSIRAEYRPADGAWTRQAVLGRNLTHYYWYAPDVALDSTGEAFAIWTPGSAIRAATFSP